MRFLAILREPALARVRPWGGALVSVDVLKTGPRPRPSLSPAAGLW